MASVIISVMERALDAETEDLVLGINSASCCWVTWDHCLFSPRYQ